MWVGEKRGWGLSCVTVPAMMKAGVLAEKHLPLKLVALPTTQINACNSIWYLYLLSLRPASKQHQVQTAVMP